MEKSVIRVWIAGAGYLGVPLAQQLQAAAYPVCASSRTPREGVVWQAWDFAAHSALQDFQAVNTWVVLLPPSSGNDYVAHMRQLCAQAQQLQLAHVVYASSTSVYGSEVRVCDEKSRVAPESDNAKQIVMCEQIWQNSGLPCISILRLGGRYDDERHPVRRLSGRVAIQGGKHPVNVVSRSQAVATLAQHIAQAQNGIFNVVAAAHPSRAEFYSQEALRLGLPLPEFDASDESSGKTVISRHQRGHI